MKQYSTLKDIFKEYWKYYGGCKAFISSAFLHFSIIVTLCLYGLWMRDGWWDIVIQIIPSILGLSLGGYAIVVSFGNERFIKLISGPSKKSPVSPYKATSSNFLHFIIAQTLSLILAISFQSFYEEYYPQWMLDTIGIDLLENMKYILWGICFLVFIYSLVTAISAAITIFKFSGFLDDFYEIEKKKEGKYDKLIYFDDTSVQGKLQQVNKEDVLFVMQHNNITYTINKSEIKAIYSPNGDEIKL